MIRDTINDIAGATVEEILEPLVAQFGIEQVLTDLAKLIGSANWGDYQRVENIARNIANRLERGAQ